MGSGGLWPFKVQRSSLGLPGGDLGAGLAAWLLDVSETVGSLPQARRFISDISMCWVGPRGSKGWGHDCRQSDHLLCACLTRSHNRHNEAGSHPTGPARHRNSKAPE